MHISAQKPFPDRDVDALGAENSGTGNYYRIRE